MAPKVLGAENLTDSEESAREIYSEDYVLGGMVHYRHPLTFPSLPVNQYGLCSVAVVKHSGCRCI